MRQKRTENAVFLENNEVMPETDQGENTRPLFKLTKQELPQISLDYKRNTLLKRRVVSNSSLVKRLPTRKTSGN